MKPFYYQIVIYNMKFQTIFIVFILIIIVVLALQLTHINNSKEGFGFGGVFGGGVFGGGGGGMFGRGQPPANPFLIALQNLSKTSIYSQKITYVSPPPAKKTPCSESVTNDFVKLIPQGDEPLLPPNTNYTTVLRDLLYWFIGTYDLRQIWDSDQMTNCNTISDYLKNLTKDPYNVTNYKEFKNLKTALETVYPNSYNNLGARIDATRNAISSKNLSYDLIYNKTDGVGNVSKMIKFYGMQQIRIGDKNVRFIPSDGATDSLLDKFNPIAPADLPDYMMFIKNLHDATGSEIVQNDKFGQYYFDNYHDVLKQLTKNNSNLNAIRDNLTNLLSGEWINSRADTMVKKFNTHLSYMECWKTPDLAIYIELTKNINEKIGIDVNFCETYDRFSRYIMKTAFPNGDNAVDVNNKIFEKPANKSDVTLQTYSDFIDLLDSVVKDKLKNTSANKWLEDIHGMSYSLQHILTDYGLGADKMRFYSTATTTTQSFTTITEESSIINYITRAFKSLFTTTENLVNTTPRGNDISTIRGFLSNKEFSVYHDAILQLFISRNLQKYATDAKTSTWDAIMQVMIILSGSGIRVDDFVTLQTAGSNGGSLSNKYVSFGGNMVYFVTFDGVLRDVSIVHPQNMGEPTPVSTDSDLRFGNNVKVKLLNDPSANEIPLTVGIPLQPEVDNADPTTIKSRAVIDSKFCKLMDDFTNTSSDVTTWVSVLKTMASYGISNYSQFTNFLNGLAQFNVYYNTNYKEFTDQLAIFGMTDYAKYQKNYNIFIEDMIRLGYNYTDNASNVNAIIRFFKSLKYNMAKYNSISMPHILLTNINNYDNNTPKYKNRVKDIQRDVDSKFLELNIDSTVVFEQVLLICISQPTINYMGKNINSLMPSNLGNIMSFTYISEYNALKNGKYPDSPETIYAFTQDLGNALVKFSKTQKYDAYLFRLLAAMLFLFPSLMFQYIAATMLNNTTYDEIIKEGQVTYRAPVYRTINTTP